MNQNYFNITKEKRKHLSVISIENIIREYNCFMQSHASVFRKTHKNRHLRIPKRNIGKTEFLKNLAKEHNTSLSNIYYVINDSKATILTTGLKEKDVYSSSTIIEKRKRRKAPNHLKVNKAKKFIDLVLAEMKKSKFNSIDETIHDFILNRKAEIEDLNTVCTKTIYNYVHSRLIDLKPIDLPRMLRRKPKSNYKTYTPKLQRGTSIDKRPFNPDDRSSFGHWEGDLVTGPRDGENGAFLTLVERQTRFYYMIPIKNKKSKSVYSAINKLNKFYGTHFKDIFKTITFDNGSEFSRFKDMEIKPGTNEKRTTIYFAHPYASSERGSNEIANQLIRYYIPKGTNINTLEKHFIKMIQLGINNKKRKILGYQPAESLFKKQLKQLLNIDFNNLYFSF